MNVDDVQLDSYVVTRKGNLVSKCEPTIRSTVVLSTVHEVGRDQGILIVRVVFSTVHEVGESKEYLLSVLFSVPYMRYRERARSTNCPGVCTIPGTY